MHRYMGAHGTPGKLGTWKTHPARSRWAAGTARAAAVQLHKVIERSGLERTLKIFQDLPLHQLVQSPIQPGLPASSRTSSTSPASQERHREGLGATATLPFSPCSAKDLQISI